MAPFFVLWPQPASACQTPVWALSCLWTSSDPYWDHSECFLDLALPPPLATLPTPRAWGCSGSAMLGHPKGGGRTMVREGTGVQTKVLSPGQVCDRDHHLLLPV